MRDLYITIPCPSGPQSPIKGTKKARSWIAYFIWRTRYAPGDKDDRTVIVPSPRKEMPHGTFASILRQSGLSKADFEK